LGLDLGDRIEEVLGEARNVIDVEVGELAVGFSEVEDHHVSACEVEGHDRHHLFTVSFESGNYRTASHCEIVADKTFKR
jgi:hypothetical protein